MIFPWSDSGSTTSGKLAITAPPTLNIVSLLTLTQNAQQIRLLGKTVYSAVKVTFYLYAELLNFSSALSFTKVQLLTTASKNP